MTVENPSWWDPNSDQPSKLMSRAKRHTSRSHIAEYIKTAFCALGVLPFVAIRLSKSQRLKTQQNKEKGAQKRQKQQKRERTQKKR